MDLGLFPCRLVVLLKLSPTEMFLSNVPIGYGSTKNFWVVWKCLIGNGRTLVANYRQKDVFLTVPYKIPFTPLKIPIVLCQTKRNGGFGLALREKHMLNPVLLSLTTLLVLLKLMVAKWK